MAILIGTVWPQVEHHGYGLDEKQVDDFVRVAATVGTPGFVMCELPSYVESTEPEEQLNVIKSNADYRMSLQLWPTLYPYATS